MALVIERRLAPPTSRSAVAAAALAAVALALLLCAGLFALRGVSPLAAYGSLIEFAFTTERGIGFSIVRATPLVLVALGTIVAWRTGFGYLGFEGCFAVGAIAATAVALAPWAPGPAGGLPFALYLPLCLGLCMAAGAAWAGSVGWLRARHGGSEVLMSLMSNYLALLAVQYVVSGPLRAPGDLPQSARLPTESWLPLLGGAARVHAGVFIAVVAALAVWALLRRTPAGYEMVVAGLNPRSACYGGIAVGRRLLQASALAGALGALAGLVQVLGVQHRLMDGMTGGVGFTGIVVALLARLHPLWVLPVALLYGGMGVGADAMQRATGVPTSIVFILQALIVLLVLASPMLLRYRLVWRAGGAATQPSAAPQEPGHG